MLEEMSHDDTVAAMMNNNRYAGDDKIHTHFYKKPKLDQVATEEAGHPVFKDVLYARVTPPGGQTMDQPVTELDRMRWADRIKKWEAAEEGGNDMPGFKLTEWNQITRSQAETLRHMNIYTVEQLADVADGNLNGMMEGLVLKERARKFLEEETGAKAQLAAMAERMAEMEARLAAAEAKPKRRARKPKVEVEEDLDDLGDALEA